MDNITTLNELIERLEEIRREIAKRDGKAVNKAGEIELRVAHQQHYPLTGMVAAVNEVDGRLWVAVGALNQYNESPYAPQAAWTGEE